MLLYQIRSFKVEMSASGSIKDQDLADQDWETLVLVKRRLSSELKNLTDIINDIDSSRLEAIAAKIREGKNELARTTEQFRETRQSIDKKNSELLSLSEKMSQSKNFLSLMIERLPQESEEVLTMFVRDNQSIVDKAQFKSQKERDEVLSRIKDASMKIEAIKATRMVREQLAIIQGDSAAINTALRELDEKLDSSKFVTDGISTQLDELYDSKRTLYAEREKHVSTYDEKLNEFEKVNERLDAMSAMRKRQRSEYGANFPSDALFKVKENAKKKLESGSKLTFEELKLLYSDQD